VHEDLDAVALEQAAQRAAHDVDDVLGPGSSEAPSAFSAMRTARSIAWRSTSSATRVRSSPSAACAAASACTDGAKNCSAAPMPAA
jgi:hypothetical protein